MSLPDRFRRGFELRDVAFDTDDVEGGLAEADDSMMAFQRITTQWSWGHARMREGLDRPTRSLLNLAMLTALGRPADLRIHVKSAFANGITVDEIKETLLHATVYCGIPAGVDALKTAHEVLEAEGAITGEPDGPDR